MRTLAALAACCLLALANAAAAATPNDVWQEYQKHPDYVSTQPRQPAPEPTPHITVEDGAGHASEPTTPQQAKSKAVWAKQEAAAQNTAAEQNTETETQSSSEKIKAQPEAQAAAQTQQTPATAKASPPKAAVGNAPKAAAPRPKPLPSLVKKPPRPRQFLRTPQPGDFLEAHSEAGGYSLLLPKAFGDDPLAQLPSAQGAMLARTANDTLMCAATALDPADTVSYQAQQPLPSYDGKKIYARWQHGEALIWDCALSRHVDFYGDKLLLEAAAKQNGKTYQLLYVMPLKQLRVYLPQALYSLDSFKLQTAK